MLDRRSGDREHRSPAEGGDEAGEEATHPTYSTTTIELPYPDPPLADGVVALRPERTNGALVLAIVDAGTGALLGWCEIRRPERDDPGRGEIGYELEADARGRGAATRGVGLLVDWAFRELGMRRVQALVHPDNEASMAVLERLGFEREGLLRSYRPDDGGDRVMFAAYSSPAS